MEQDEYVRKIVAAHTPNDAHDVQAVITAITPHIHLWANGHLYELKPSGSYAKGTAITETTDVDIFISLNPSVATCNTHENVYKSLTARLNSSGYTAREQNVSLGVKHGLLDVDFVPGVQHDIYSGDHSLWKNKQKTWTKTNIDKHISHIKNSGRAFDIRAIKIWRKLHKLDFPSFYLELSVIEALKDTTTTPSQNFIKVMNYLIIEFVSKTIYDPAVPSKEVSDELTLVEKNIIKQKAVSTLAGNWEQAIW
ncbi:MAG: nucleotidyltransferase [Candidatus Paceibacterota bacterium]